MLQHNLLNVVDYRKQNPKDRNIQLFFKRLCKIKMVVLLAEWMIATYDLQKQAMISLQGMADNDWQKN